MTDMKRSILILLTLSATIIYPTFLQSQILHPEGGFVFDDSDVPRIDISISPTNLATLYANPYSDVEYKALFSFTRGDSTESLLDIGLRFRGNTSRGNEKKAFRISFNSFDEGRDFHGIEKMNLNAETNDPSLVRSKLTWHLFRYLGVPGSRSNHVLLYINNTFYGVYINTEHYDEKFVRSRFDSNDGNLYKCLYPADLTFLGEDQDLYKFVHEERRAYEQRINEEWDDYEDLSRFIKMLDHYSGEQLKAELERVFNVQQYLKVMAVDVMTGNWDGYIGNQNNYFLYRDPVTGRFEYLPYDLDNTFGIDWLDTEWSDRSIYSWHRNQRPLYEKILAIEEYKQQYTTYIKKLAEYMTSADLIQELERWRSQISTAVSQDPYYPLDWGYAFADFENALDSSWGTHVVYGIQDFITRRSASALAESIQADAPPAISHARIEPAPGRIDVDWIAEDDSSGFTTTLHYRINQAEWQSRLMDYPVSIDEISGLSAYRDSILSLEEDAEVDIYFTVMDRGGQEVQYPATYLTAKFPLLSGLLYINEFMASNSTKRVDEYGEYDDWVEIYNPADTQVWLGDIYLSDDMGNPGRYKFPDIYIEPTGYYTVWLDGDTDQGENHASFKLSRDGEDIRLSERPANGFTLIDSVTFGLQQTDIALGRAIDGGSQWIAFSQPTPGYSNLSTGWEEIHGNPVSLMLYPNPVRNGILHFSREVSGAIYNAMGQLVRQFRHVNRINLESAAAGIYIFRSSEGESLPFVITR